MKTLVLPCAGRSSRFPDLPPKWMLQNDDKESMIESVIDAMPEDFDRTIITITQQQQDQWGAFDFLNLRVKEGVDIDILSQPTNSASETVYQTLQDCHVEGAVTIKDCDCKVEYKECASLNFIVGINVKKDSDIKRLEAKSFIEKNDNNIIEDIIEKKMVSNDICVGVYSCDADNYLESYNFLTESDVYFQTQEVYVSHIFSHMVLSGAAVFSYIEATRFVDWGTLEDWENNKDG